MIEKYIISSIQNNSKLNQNALKALETYAEHNNATLILLPIKYNPYKLDEKEIFYP